MSYPYRILSWGVAKDEGSCPCDPRHDLKFKFGWTRTGLEAWWCNICHGAFYFSDDLKSCAFIPAGQRVPLDLALELGAKNV
jgi:hypothetical protein